MLRECLTRLRFLLFRRKPSDLDEELQFHLEHAIATNLEAGMSPIEARRQVIIAFGGLERAREECHRQRPGWFLETVMQDMKYALRGFRRNPIFTIAAVATLALGIGATTAVFSVVDRILFRSLPYAHDDRIVSVGLVQSLERQEFTLGGFFYDWRDNQKPFEAIASQGTMSHACDLVETNPAQLNCISAQAGFLPLLGISPMLGRNFLPEEDRPNGPRVALISYGLWRTHYNLDPGTLNRLIDINGSPVRVIGVLPKDFELPTLQTADVIMPMALDEVQERTSSPGSPMRTFARLKPGVSIARAKAEMEPLFSHTQQKWIPPTIRNDFHLSIRSLRDRETQDVRPVAWILLGAVLSVLLIACANVASLMAARRAARQHELVVRSVLGASRGRLMQQTLTEAFLLSLAGAVMGLGLAEGLLRVFLAIAPTGIPFLNKAKLDFRIALLTMLLSLVCGAIFGLVPALQKPRAAVLAARAAHSRRHVGLRRSLVIGQIAMSMILLSGAALLLRSFQNVEEQRLGIETHGVLTTRIVLPGFSYNTSKRRMEFYLQAEAAVRSIPGIQAVGWSDSFPPGGWQSGRRFADFVVEGKPRPTPGTGGSVVYREVTPDYFRALNIPIIRGRNFTEGDRKIAANYFRAPDIPTIQGQSFAAVDRSSSERQIILSQLMASRVFHSENPIGQRVQMGSGEMWSTVVGVAGNVKNSGLIEQDEPEIYILRRDVAEDWDGEVSTANGTGGGGPVMVFETMLSPKAVAPWVRLKIAQLDSTVPIEIQPLDERVSKMADRPRFETTLLSFFAFTGLLLAVIGLYGVISFLATQRKQEIGVRMALGASRTNILALILWEGGRLIIPGSVLGLGAALVMSRLLKSMLFQVKLHDPLSFIGVAALLAATAFIATLIPARSAMKVDPNIALRYE